MSNEREIIKKELIQHAQEQIREADISAIRKTESFKNGDYHQAILDVAYDEWQRHNQWNYSDMISWTQHEYGDWFAMMILLGKYNQQVCNGGHEQYLINRCASIGRDDIELHMKMENWFDFFGLDQLEHGKEVLSIAKNFRPNMDESVERVRELSDEWIKKL